MIDLRDQLAFAMYLVAFEAENLPGPPQDLGELATRWVQLRDDPDPDVRFLADTFLALADRMIAHWDRCKPVNAQATTPSPQLCTLILRNVPRDLVLAFHRQAAEKGQLPDELLRALFYDAFLPDQLDHCLAQRRQNEREAGVGSEE